MPVMVVVMSSVAVMVPVMLVVMAFVVMAVVSRAMAAGRWC